MNESHILRSMMSCRPMNMYWCSLRIRIKKMRFNKPLKVVLPEQTNLYDGYAPDQVQLLKQAVVDIQANYALYVVDTNAKTMDEQFLESL